jgi:hypothetical protein
MGSERAWRDIRALRAAPPDLAGQDKRRQKVFSAALQQAEELHGASAQSGFSSRPLTLFYALSQGGRAIAAAKTTDSSWQFGGHGLETKFAGEDVLKARVAPKGQGAFQVVSKATLSPAPRSALSLGALLATLPDVSQYVALDPHPRSLQLELEYESTLGEHAVLVPPYGSLAIYCGPEASLPGDQHLEAMAKLLEPCGRTRGWAIVPSVRYSAGRPCIALTWQLQDAEGGRGYRAIDEVSTRAGDYFYLRPTLGVEDGEINILMTWWAALLALSSLARYEPAAWRAALDVDSSSIAVLLEHVLEVAQERLPELLLAALAIPKSEAAEAA